MKQIFTKKIGVTIISALLVVTNFTLSIAQQNALAFDGTDDFVTTPAASSLISGSNNISITCWVYPENPTPQTTSYDGLCGFRNNTDGDFYMLHYSATTIEARFRNSSGTTFDVTGTGIQINAWQHLVFTYDGSMLRYYRNAALLDSMAANGTIVTSGDNFYIGGLPFQTYIFNLVGKMDDVSLWNKTLSQSDINSIYTCGVDSNDTGLQLLYRFNQGIAGGSNTSITTVSDASGHIDGDLNNFSMTGTASNFVTGFSTTAFNVSAGICTGDSYLFGSQVLTTAGVYHDTLTSVNGCDSIVTLTLTVASVDTSVALFSTVLHANQAGASYQWVDCNNGYAVIPGAASQNYVVTAAGNYAVIVTLNGCSDTSACHTVTFAGIPENSLNDYVHLYPNPVDNYLSIDFDQKVRNATIQISDVEGRIIWSTTNNNNRQLKIDASNWAAGIYILKVKANDSSAEFRLLKK